jgi:putative salt-induced outer membrane protein YdiY
MRLFSPLLLTFALFLPAALLRAQEAAAPAAPAAAPEAAVASPAATEPAPAPAPVAEEKKPAPAPPAYDEIVVKGTTLQGHVLDFSEKSITFETIYGTGKIEIAYTDIEQFKTQNSFRFIQRDGESVRGRVAQLSTRDLVVAEHSGEVKLMKPADLERVIPEVGTSSSFTDKMHNIFPFTKVKFDFGWNLESGAVNTVEISGGLNVERRKTPTRLVLDVRAAYEYDEATETAPSKVSKDEYRASLIYEYDLTGPRYAFAFPIAERDATRNIVVRAYPSAGVGYRLAETGKLRFQVQAGLAYVYEDFIDYPDNEYAALHVGFEGGYQFTQNYGVTWKTYYYPGLEDYTLNWLFRTEMIFDARLTKAFSLNLRLTDTLDNTPAPDVGDNKFTTTLSLLFTF